MSTEAFFILLALSLRCGSYETSSSKKRFAPRDKEQATDLNTTRHGGFIFLL
jgi:hypothetical protein